MSDSAAASTATPASTETQATSAAAPTSSSHPIDQAIQATPQELGHKVFVGNLPFSVTGDSIKEVFAKVGNVTDAQIIHRGTRSLGYGFVTFTSESDAAAAVSQLDKSEIAGRQVNVEVAKPMPTAGANGAAGAAASAPRRAAKKAAQMAATKQTAQEASTSEGEGAAGGAKKARKARKPRGPRVARADDETEEAGDAPVSNTAVSDAADALAGVSISDKQPRTSKRKPRARKDRSKSAAATGADGEVIPGAETGEPPALGARQPAASTSTATRTRRGPPSTGVESSTLVFVGNLNFNVTNASLKEAFEPECKVKSAVVVVRKFGQSAGRSKGFAFVDFESNEDQKRALDQFQGKELDGRPMSIKVAIQPEEGHEAAEANKKAEKAAAAAAAKDSSEPAEQAAPVQQRTEGDAVIVAQ
ncbi:hypothetical protein BMF94_2447 [Rhodotorula taiwanensis]|uniref:RRM domain-containing protein n=1 Tax=Rhodotorula taiwanensis TaxID=741276 RepID=A0A2S5BD26_9BASI|nr:hypothetical protein BMF94_2447 [Rhodotorula taiwanensis]